VSDELGEVELTAAEVERILKVCGPHALLVGGQALAAWAVYYGIEPIGDLSRAVTTDANFIGTREIARRLQRALGAPWKLRQGSWEDLGPQIVKLYVRLPHEGIKQVHFLSAIVGLDTEAVRRRASMLNPRRWNGMAAGDIETDARLLGIDDDPPLVLARGCREACRQRLRRHTHI
jgi:hypothetical protein